MSIIVINIILNSFETILYTFYIIKNVIQSSLDAFLNNNIKIAFSIPFALMFDYF